MNSELINDLQRIGLNNYESKAYLALLDSGPLSASELSDKTDIPRPRTYDILKKLDDKGIVSTQPGRPAKYNANPVEESMENLKKREEEKHRETLEEIDEVKGKLKRKAPSMESTGNEKPEDSMWFLRDRDKINSKIKSLLQTAEEEIVIATDSEEAREHIERYGSMLREAEERGANVKLITDRAERFEDVSDFAEVIEEDHGHRFIGVDDHSVLFLNPRGQKEDVGAWIKSPYFTKSLKNRLHPRDRSISS